MTVVLNVFLLTGLYMAPLKGTKDALQEYEVSDKKDKYTVSQHIQIDSQNSFIQQLQ